MLLALILLAPSASHAQSSQAELQTRLLHKPLYLVGRWRNDHLKFDSAGQLRSKSDTGSFTTSGINVQGVELGNNGLTIHGSRVGLIFRGGAIERAGIGEGDKPGGHPEAIVIQVAAPPDGSYESASDAILTEDLSRFIPTLPDYWQTYGREHLLHPVSETAMPDDPDGPPEPGEHLNTRMPAPGTTRIGGAVTPPKVLHMTEPQFSREARSAFISGSVLVYLQVDTEGNPMQIRILRPIGLGLDEKAVEAVSHYKFKPATLNGSPVRVEMNVEVNFQIF